jgi:hypothetical protein
VQRQAGRRGSSGDLVRYEQTVGNWYDPVGGSKPDESCGVLRGGQHGGALAGRACRILFATVIQRTWNSRVMSSVTLYDVANDTVYLIQRTLNSVA